MKRLILFLPVFLIFWSCQDDIDSSVDNKSQIEKLNVENVDSAFLSKPPTDNPIMIEFFLREKNLLKADQVYRENIRKAEGLPYYDNLRQYGFQAVFKHGLVEEGTSEQKLFYITEQLNSIANLPNIPEFYLLLISAEKNFTKDELIDFGTKFYVKNLNLIENEIKYPNDEMKSDRILKLKMVFKDFKRKVQLIKD